jgi:hypothetical protein
LSSERYGEDAPQNALERVEEIARSVGLETFKDKDDVVVLAGKVIVLDVEFGAEVTVKVSYANASSALSTGLGAYLAKIVGVYLKEAEPLKRAKLSRDVRDQLLYIVRLDKLASESGMAWFLDIDKVAREAEEGFG